MAPHPYHVRHCILRWVNKKSVRICIYRRPTWTKFCEKFDSSRISVDKRFSLFLQLVLNSQPRLLATHNHKITQLFFRVIQLGIKILSSDIPNMLVNIATFNISIKIYPVVCSGYK